jgi:hypothetical protein
MVNDGLLLLLALMALLLVMFLYAVITLSPQDAAARTEPPVLHLPAPSLPAPASPWLQTPAAPAAAAGQPGHSASPAWHLDAAPAPSLRQPTVGTSAKAATPATVASQHRWPNGTGRRTAATRPALRPTQNAPQRAQKCPIWRLPTSRDPISSALRTAGRRAFCLASPSLNVMGLVGISHAAVRLGGRCDWSGNCRRSEVSQAAGQPPGPA